MQMLACYLRWGFVYAHSNGWMYIVDETTATPRASELKTFADVIEAEHWINRTSWIEREEGGWIRWADKQLKLVSVTIEVRMED